MSDAQKIKLVLRGEDGSTEHAQGIVDGDKYSSATLVERNDRIYVFRTSRFEGGMIVGLFDEVAQPIHITEF